MASPQEAVHKLLIREEDLFIQLQMALERARAEKAGSRTATSVGVGAGCCIGFKCLLQGLRGEPNQMWVWSHLTGLTMSSLLGAVLEFQATLHARHP